MPITWKTLFYSFIHSFMCIYIYIYVPLGIHVSRTDSRRFLLLKAVFMPMTTKAFLRTLLVDNEPSREEDEVAVWLVLATASSISSAEIVLSNDLKLREKKKNFD